MKKKTKKFLLDLPIYIFMVFCFWASIMLVRSLDATMEHGTFNLIAISSLLFSIVAYLSFIILIINDVIYKLNQIIGGK